ncbi:hypothetical protein PORUE0001_0743 [Porphyromonas uenonis 60-3]|uniref:Uncharacterized protein n=1 Tax=Porphyromonas uenonis 60-3 TaxID=596327 RepID=C2MEC9_9PORP|nr:hypothetical protein PORUE0001_0743 [Porphyromonas uenonis 60-3]
MALKLSIHIDLLLRKAVEFVILQFTKITLHCYLWKSCQID